MTQITLITAFTAGLATFLAPCTFVALPAFIAYLSSQVTEKDKDSTRKYKIFLSAILYVIGFLIVFTIMGILAGKFGSQVNAYKPILTKISAAIIVLLGVFMLAGYRFRKLSFLYQDRKISFKPNRIVKGYLFPFFIGTTSALAWTPCIGPILGSILLMASSTGNSTKGAILLLIYGLGITTPFLLSALFLDKIAPYIAKSGKIIHKIHKVSAVILIIMGLAYLTGFSSVLNGYLLKIFLLIGYSPA